MKTIKLSKKNISCYKSTYKKYELYKEKVINRVEEILEIICKTCWNCTNTGHFYFKDAAAGYVGTPLIEGGFVKYKWLRCPSPDPEINMYEKQFPESFLYMKNSDIIKIIKKNSK